MIIVQYSFSKYGAWDSTRGQYSFAIVKNSIRYIPASSGTRYGEVSEDWVEYGMKSGGHNYLGSFKLELIYA